MRRIIIQIFTVVSTLFMGVGCAVNVEEEIRAEFNGEGTVVIEGGRERIACSWRGLSSDVEEIILSVRENEQVRSNPVSSADGMEIHVGFPEGRYSIDLLYRCRDGEEYAGPTCHVEVLGEKYESSLKTFKPSEYDFEGALGTVVLDNEEKLAGVEYMYRSACGEEKTGYAEVGEGDIVISINDLGDEFSYRNVIRPSELTGDTFRSPYITLRNNTVKASVKKSATVDGYRGIWFTLGQESEYGDKYSGGLGTYTMKHIPMAAYAPAVDRTYFVYGGTPSSTKKYLQCMIGCYDHKTGKLQKPRVVYDKGVNGVKDPHDDPTIQIDKYGYIWVFVAGRGNNRPGIRFRSLNPYDISEFEYVNESIMAYPQIHYDSDKGFFLFFTRYDGTRQLFFQTSEDGVNWTPYTQLASIKGSGESKSGHYQFTNLKDGKLVSCFNRHINGAVDTRTNIYYVQSLDWGRTWTTVDGREVKLPITKPDDISLVHDYRAEKKNCYIKDINFDKDNNPVILYLTSDNHYPGPRGGIRQWYVVNWDGSKWNYHELAQSTHCYDSGSIWIDENNVWTIIAPTDTGAQYWGAGGEMVMWRSTDEGNTWNRVYSLTRNSENNHTYARRPQDADDEFYSFWADGNTDTFSISYLYFCNKGGKVRRMPYNMTEEWQKPELY